MRNDSFIRELGRKWPWLLFAFIGIVLDFITKQWAERSLLYGVSEEVLPFLYWTRIHNPGAAFSFLADQAGWQRWFFTAVSFAASLFIIHWIGRTKRSEKILLIGLTSILAGAIGNLIDRLLLGYVIDFIHLTLFDYHFPIFNVADIFVTVGVVFVLFSSFFHQEEEKRGKNSLIEEG